MRRIASLCALAALGLATASQAAAESNLDILDPIGKGPARAFRASAVTICVEDACNLKFGKVPKKTIMIIKTVTCASTPVGDAQKDGAAVTTGELIVGLVPPSANPNIKLLTSAYLPFRAGETPSVRLGGQSGSPGVCNATGRLLSTN